MHTAGLIRITLGMILAAITVPAHDLTVVSIHKGFSDHCAMSLSSQVACFRDRWAAHEVLQ